MAKLRSSGKKNNGILKLKIVAKMIQKSFLRDLSSNQVPEDVKEGHVAVLAHVDGDEPKRFIVPLNYLTHPTFVRLLKQAAEEYGFDREGALTIPCRPCELERILSEQCQNEGEDHSGVGVKWSFYNSMIQSC